MKNLSTKEKALDLFSKGFNCSQSVFVGCNDFLPIKAKDALKVAGGFGGGMRCGEVCGAVTGAIMAIGTKHSQTKSFDTKSKQITSELVLEFENNFKKKFGSIRCKDLLGSNLAIPNEAEKIYSEELTKKLCPKFVGYAAEQLDEKFNT